MSETFIEEVRSRLREFEHRLRALERAMDLRRIPGTGGAAPARLLPWPACNASYLDGDVIMGSDPARPFCDETVVLPPEVQL